MASWTCCRSLLLHLRSALRNLPEVLDSVSMLSKMWGTSTAADCWASRVHWQLKRTTHQNVHMKSCPKQHCRVRHTDTIYRSLNFDCWWLVSTGLVQTQMKTRIQKMPRALVRSSKCPTVFFPLPSILELAVVIFITYPRSANLSVPSPKLVIPHRSPPADLHCQPPLNVLM